MENIILTTATRQALVNEVALEVLTGIESLLDERAKPPNDTEYLTGKEVESILKISTQTRYDWGAKGILQPYKIGSRRRYKRDEVYSALRALETQNV
jgi:predicted DNA-binding transcriptional regulator AlpA